MNLSLKTRVSEILQNAFPTKRVWCINVTVPMYLCCAEPDMGPALLAVGNPPFRRVFPQRPLTDLERAECRLVGL